MSDINDITKLDNYESEDVGDVVLKLEKSFGLKFGKNAFMNVNTFGDLCDVFNENLNYENRNDCTTQQAFYKIRKAVSSTQGTEESQIQLDSDLISLFPKYDRRKRIKEFQAFLGTDIKMLTYPGWLADAFVIGLILSLIAFFFDWKLALSGIVFFILAMKIADRMGNDFDLQTVRQLAEKMTREAYVNIRRSGYTVNRKEISAIIIETFSKDLAIEKTYLTRDAKFNWAQT